MDGLPRLPKSVSEARRQRDVLSRYGLAFRDIHRLGELSLQPENGSLPIDHIPRPSKDSSLTAFAQLACIHLSASRAMISLLDDQRQHILAEATPKPLLRSDSTSDIHSNLRIGNISIPRAWGLCERVLSLDCAGLLASEGVAAVIADATQDEQVAQRMRTQGGLEARFYAGVPLTSPEGAIVGTLCIFDDKKRDGLPRQDILFLLDLAVTVSEYLDTYTVRDQYRRSEQLIHALLSFGESASTLRNIPNDNQQASQNPLRSSFPPSEIPLETACVSQHDNPRKPPVLSQRTSKTSVTSHRSVYSQNESVKALQESILPANSRSLFEYAAKMIQASSNLDGVMILDASVSAISNQHHVGIVDGGSDNSDSSPTSKSSSSEDDGARHNRQLPRNTFTKRYGRTCQVLAAVLLGPPEPTQDGPTSSPDMILEADLTRLLRMYPNGKVLNFTAEGESMVSTDESDSSGDNAQGHAAPGQSTKENFPASRSYRITKAMQAVFPKARSIAFVPFWDYERSRWFAGCLCWSNHPHRLLSEDVDLAYMKVFGNSIMAELSRLDALSLNQAKTSFVASISHELRSPLHGILGTLQFLHDTALDSFQVSMLNSLFACGQTLLDTINHVLDYSQLNERKKSASTKTLRSPNSVRLSSKPRKQRGSGVPAAQDSGFDLGLVTEEVVEAVFSGRSFLAVDQGPYQAPNQQTTEVDQTISPNSTSRPDAERASRFIILDIAHEIDWQFCIGRGAWRRIVMNLFGNALKYTTTGRVRVSLRCENSSKDNNPCKTVVLVVADSGRGISPEFLANRLFQAFSQENSHSHGIGLGLSIVRQIVETVGGKIDVTSDPLVGTTVTAKFSLPSPEITPIVVAPRTSFLNTLSRLRGRRICLLHKERLPLPSELCVSEDSESLKQFTTAIATTLMDHLEMDVVHTNNWREHDADIVICSEPSFEYLSAIRRQRRIDQRAPITIFVAMDALEAATLRTDARVLSKESVVEIMMQPCGPYKLAHILEHCLKRFESPEENIWVPIPATVSPLHRGRELPQTSEPTLTLSPNLQEPVSRSEPPSSNSLNALETLYPTSSPIITSEAAAATLGELSQSNEPNTLSRGGEKAYKSHVLVTDDNPINRKLLVTFLDKRHIPYREAKNGLEALQAFQQGDITFGLVFMDMSMPVMDGMTATRAIREHEQKCNIARTCIVALTGLASASARLEAWGSGVDHFMTKPIDFKSLDKLVKERLEMDVESETRQ